MHARGILVLRYGRLTVNMAMTKQREMGTEIGCSSTTYKIANSKQVCQQTVELPFALV